MVNVVSRLLSDWLGSGVPQVARRAIGLIAGLSLILVVAGVVVTIGLDSEPTTAPRTTAPQTLTTPTFATTEPHETEPTSTTVGSSVVAAAVALRRVGATNPGFRIEYCDFLLSTVDRPQEQAARLQAEITRIAHGADAQRLRAGLAKAQRDPFFAERLYTAACV
jgi:hypothetical protein